MIMLHNVAEDAHRRLMERPRSELTSRVTLTIPAGLMGRIDAAAEIAGVNRSALVSVVMANAVDDWEADLQKHGPDAEDDE
jgi:hypothetical protein